MDLPAGTFNKSYSQDDAIFRTRLQKGMFSALLLLLCVIPLFTGEQWVSVINNIGITLIALLGLNILTGYCGQISIGHSGFVAVGAYFAAILSANLGWSAWATLPVAVLGSAFVGLIFGLPALRVKGFYLAMTTLGAYYIIIWGFGHGGHLTGGVHGLAVARASIGNLVINTETELYYMIMALVVICIFLAKNLVRTRVGRAFVAIRDNDLAAEVLGINLAFYKLLAFAIACGFAGLAGWLRAYYVGYVQWEMYPLMDSIWWLGILIVGGMGSIMGVIFGTVFILLLWEGTAILAPVLGGVLPGSAFQISAALGQMVVGIVIALFIVFEPRGINHRWQLFKTYYRMWPFSY